MQPPLGGVLRESAITSEEHFTATQKRQIAPDSRSSLFEDYPRNTRTKQQQDHLICALGKKGPVPELTGSWDMKGCSNVLGFPWFLSYLACSCLPAWRSSISTKPSRREAQLVRPHCKKAATESATPQPRLYKYKSRQTSPGKMVKAVAVLLGQSDVSGTVTFTQDGDGELSLICFIRVGAKMNMWIFIIVILLVFQSPFLK